MFLLGLPFVYGLALGAIVAVLLVMAGALTLLPAMLGFAGRAIDRLHVPHLLRRAGPTTGHDGFWWRWSRVVQRHPWPARRRSPSSCWSCSPSRFLHAPGLHRRRQRPDRRSRPARPTTCWPKGSGPGINGPLVIAARLPRPAASAPRSTALDQAMPRHARASPSSSGRSSTPAADAAVIIASPTTAPQAAATAVAGAPICAPTVSRRRHAGTGVRAWSGARQPAASTPPTTWPHRLPWVIGAGHRAPFLLLMAVFRSVAVPVKAAIMNLLSVGAAYGVIVAVFQWGWLGSVIGIGKTAPIDPWVPLMMFTILFGLSMDYEVFLLSRIREEWRRTGDNATVGGRRPGHDGSGDHRGGRHHGLRLRLLRARRPAPGAQAVRPGTGHGGPRRRHPGADGPRALHHGAARRGQLVAARAGWTGSSRRLSVEVDVGEPAGRPPADAAGRPVQPEADLVRSGPTD